MRCVRQAAGMAMTVCAECGKDISTSAVMCPHCGAPPEVALAAAAVEMPVDEAPLGWLEVSVREALHQPKGKVDLGRVEMLKREGAGVVDLNPVVAELRRLPVLKMLSLSRNEISDVGPLAELGGLRYLFLEKNRISDVSALCELKALKQLWLYGNPLQSEDIIMMEQAVPRCEVFF